MILTSPRNFSQSTCINDSHHVGCINCHVIQSSPGVFSKKCGCYLCEDCYTLLKSRITSIKCNHETIKLKMFKPMKNYKTDLKLKCLYESYFYDGRTNEESAKHYNDFLEFKENLLVMREKGLNSEVNKIIKDFNKDIQKDEIYNLKKAKYHADLFIYNIRKCRELPVLYLGQQHTVTEDKSNRSLF